MHLPVAAISLSFLLLSSISNVTVCTVNIKSTNYGKITIKINAENATDVNSLKNRSCENVRHKIEKV